MLCSGTKYSHENFFIHEMFLKILSFGLVFLLLLLWLFLLGVEVAGTAVSLCFCFQ